MPTRSTVLALIVAFGAIACAPPALDPDHASGSSAESTGKKSSKKKSSSKTAGDDDTTGDDDDDTTSTQKQTTNKGSSSSGGAATTATDDPQAPASFAAVYNGLKTACGSCHLSGAAGAPSFFGDTEQTTYANFLNQNFNSSPSPLVTKGQHSGPALTPDQQSAVEAWVAADPAQ